MAWPTDSRNIIHLHLKKNKNENGRIAYTIKWKCRRKRISATSETCKLTYGFPLIISEMYKLNKLD